jgi:inosine-uridine nucleoside N-ribohydrolase
MNRIRTILVIAVILFAQSFAQTVFAGHPYRVIVETDMGNDIDDAFALDILYKAADAGKVKILGISNHKQSDYASSYIDILNTWYGYRKIPIAKSSKCIVNTEATDYTEPVCKMTDDKQRPLFATSKKKKDILESVAFYRKTLSRQPDHSVTILSLGFATALNMVLESAPDKYSKLNGRELIARKVKSLSIMAGSFGPKKRAEFNVVNDLSAMQNLFKQWPTEIVLNPFELGKSVVYPAKVVEQDYSWATHHPVVEGYVHYHKMPYNRPTWDLMSVIYLFHPELFTKSERGTIAIDAKGYTIFTPSSEGNHYVLSASKEQTDSLKQYIIKTTTSIPHRYKK